MEIPNSKFDAWKSAETELLDIERTFKAMSSDLTPSDRTRVTQQLAALRQARLRVRLLFEEVMRESESMIARLAAEEDDARSSARSSPSDQDKRLDWLL
jgi:hypothetical protein